MKQTDQIRELLNEIDSATSCSEDRDFAENFNALELPEIACSIIDFLQPILRPYEAAIYWFLFRQSILGIGRQYARVSVRGMTKGVITSASGQSAKMSYKTVQMALAGLEELKAIIKTGDTNREGTLYKVCLPEEIPDCLERMKEEQKTELIQVDEKKDLDFYNYKENRAKVFERDGYKCCYCGKQLTRFSATLDHIQPVSKGGDNSYDNLVTSCLHCNSQRGNRPVMDIVTEKDSQPQHEPDACQ